MQSQSKRRPWTTREQTIAEVAAACGVSLYGIGQALRRSPSCVEWHLLPQKAENGRQRARTLLKQNPEANRERCRRWREENREAKLKINRRYREQNRLAERKRVSRWREQNPEANRNYIRRWREQNPEAVRTASRENTRRRYALKRAGRRRALIPLTPHTKAQRFSLFQDRCAYCGSCKNLTIDHVLALTKGGLDEPINVVPACGRCNRSKYTNPVEDWYRQQSFFSEDRWLLIKCNCPTAVVRSLGLALPTT